MGATNFYTEADGDTMAEAFHNAVQDAYYWHGHGGYSGTIAEKPGATKFSVPLTALPEPPEGARYPSLGERVSEALGYYAYEGDAGLAKESPSEWEARWQNDAKALIKAMGKPAFVQMAHSWDEKWENAVGFLVSKGRYAFCGIASC